LDLSGHWENFTPHLSFGTKRKILLRNRKGSGMALGREVEAHMNPRWLWTHTHGWMGRYVFFLSHCSSSSIGKGPKLPRTLNFHLRKKFLEETVMG
jgi:hypothetical protein